MDVWTKFTLPYTVTAFQD